MEPNTKNTKNIWIAIMVVLILLAGGAYYFSTRGNGNSIPTGNESRDESPLQADAVMITAKHSFANGKHIVAGEVQVPTPCTSLDVKAVVDKFDTSKVSIVFQTINESEICVQVVANRRFKVEFNAPAQVQISATWNGISATLNLISIGPGEDLENFEIFLKG